MAKREIRDRCCNTILYDAAKSLDVIVSPVITKGFINQKESFGYVVVMVNKSLASRGDRGQVAHVETKSLVPQQLVFYQR